MKDKQKQAVLKQLTKLEAAFAVYKQVLLEALSCNRETVSPLSNKHIQQELAQRKRLVIRRLQALSTRPQSRRGTSRRGFASLSAEQRSLIAGMGGKAAHAMGKRHVFTHAEAQAAGRRGGLRRRGKRIALRKGYHHVSSVNMR